MMILYCHAVYTIAKTRHVILCQNLQVYTMSVCASYDIGTIDSYKRCCAMRVFSQEGPLGFFL